MEGDKRKNPSIAEPALAPNVGIRIPARLDRDKVVKEGCEISVFGAEKYFNMKLDDDRLDDEYSDKPSHVKMTPRRWPGTPSASSEASWNSQTGLLRSSTMNRSENRLKKVHGRSFFSNLSCTGSCSNTKSVHVNHNVDHHGKEYIKDHNRINQRPSHIDRRKLSQAKLQIKEPNSVRSNREVYYTRPPVLKPGLQNVKVGTLLDDDPRNSLEVFGSDAMKKGDIDKNLERKLSMLTWDAIPNAQTISSVSRSSQIEDNIESDASSDLFEIDNISANGGQALFTRQAYDDMSSCMTPYAPSETSIEWTVVTASAADCSFVSDYDEKKNRK